ncbi:MAG: restriction endonuclease [bacterium]
MDRTPGRYNLHKLGWKAFEDVIVEVHRVLLGETVTPFRTGADEGRDGFYRGHSTKEYRKHVPNGAKVVVQCKHSGTPGEGIVWSDVSGELEKVRALRVAGEVDLYVIATNKRLSASAEAEIRRKFEAIDGLTCLVLGEEWVESTIDGQFRLLRRVPRLYGVGDLSQILSTTVAEQTQLVLEELSGELAVFVPTPAFRKAVAAMEDHGLVFVVGPPASGKSAIATNLCVALGAENPDIEVLRVENPAQFSEMWSARDSNKLFWIEDVFGETRLDQTRAENWQRVFEKIWTALKAGNRFIFTCRDYILNESHAVIRKSLLDRFRARTIFVETSELSSEDRSRILYNHIKFGDLPNELKTRLKPHLPAVARSSSFTPELARRLGTLRFHHALEASYSEKAILHFIEEPLHFFEEVIHDLSKPQQASIALLLLSGNALSSPVEGIPASVERAYGVTISDVREALRTLEGSLTRLVIIGSDREWRVHHPSMIDAMHKLLRDDLAMLDLFLDAAPVQVLVRDVSTRPREHTVFVPASLYNKLGQRVLNAEPLDAVRFMLDQTPAFRQAAVANFPDELALLMGEAITWKGDFRGLQLLGLIREEGISFPEAKDVLGAALTNIVWRFGWFPDDVTNAIELVGSENVAFALEADANVEELLPSYFNVVQRNASDYTEVEEVLDRVKRFPERVKTGASALLKQETAQRVVTQAEIGAEQLSNLLDQYIIQWAQHEDDAYDRYRDGYYGPGTTASGGSDGMFSDVDK